MDDLISRAAAIDAFERFIHEFSIDDEPHNYGEMVLSEDNVPSAQSQTCEGCKHLGKWENEVEYGYPFPCTCCKRRVEDHYEK